MKVIFGEKFPRMIGEVRCNKCGKVLDEWDMQQDFTVEKRLSYGSKYDDDMLVLRLCNDCMDELIASCVIDPTENI